MKIDQVEKTLLSVKFLIDNRQTHKNSFNDVALDLYRLHHEMNNSYYQYCGRKIPSNWKEIPLLPISQFNNKNFIGLDMETEMPFPGLFFKSNLSFHYIRDTELYKNSIARSFPQIVLNENSWVPWINFISVFSKTENNCSNYFLEYLAESFHGKSIENFGNFELFLKDLIEENGEEIKISIPTVFVSNQIKLKEFINKFDLLKKEYQEGLPLPLGSKIIEIQNGFQENSLNISKTICEIFGMNQIMRVLLIPEISSQMYAIIKTSSLEYCLKNNKKEITEYFSSPWIRFRIIDSNTKEDVGQGESGLVAIYDLANFWSCPFILTDFYGKIGRSGGLILEGKISEKNEKVNC
jgi:hypothetical protein